jgi:hypothetical protein
MTRHCPASPAWLRATPRFCNRAKVPALIQIKLARGASDYTRHRRRALLEARPMPRSKPVEEEKDQESAPELPALAISPEKVCFVIVKAREFDVKDAVTEPDTGSNASDDNMISVLEDHGDDPVLEELTAFISSLSEDEQVDLVALAWLGRDDNTIEDWEGLREEAARAHGTRTTHTADYLLGMPLLGDYLEEGLSLFGQSCGEYELNRL